MTSPASAGRPERPSTFRPLPTALVTWVFIGVILVLVVALLVVKLTRGAPPAAGAAPPAAPASVVSALASLPEAAYDAAAATPATATGPGPQVLAGQAPLTAGGLDEVVFVGGESSPYSAAASWAVVSALARLGRFSDLGATTSPAHEVFTGTPGFSFLDSHYRSAYVAFEATEVDAATLSSTAPAGYPALQTPSSSVAALVRRYGGGNGGSLPFVDVAGRLLAIGAGIGFSPGLLAGDSMGQVAAALADPTRTLSRAVLWMADEISAAICAADGGQPAAVCNGAGVQTAEVRLGL